MEIDAERKCKRLVGGVIIFFRLPYLWKPLMTDVVHFIQAQLVVSEGPERIHLPDTLRHASSFGEVLVLQHEEQLTITFYRLRVWGPEYLYYLFTTEPLSDNRCQFLKQEGGFWYACVT